MRILILEYRCFKQAHLSLALLADNDYIPECVDLFRIKFQFDIRKLLRLKI